MRGREHEAQVRCVLGAWPLRVHAASHFGHRPRRPSYLSLPRWLEVLARLSPTTYIVDTLRHVLYGADGTMPRDVFACAAGNYAAAYRLVGGGWERYFPDRPEISNMGPLDEYDAFLILVTAPVSCTMPIAP